MASIFGHTKIAHRLLEYNADVKVQNKDNETPLHLALACGHLEIAQMLIERGASVSPQNKDDQTPLHLVFLGNRNQLKRTFNFRLREVARMFKFTDHSTDVSVQNEDNRTQAA